MLRQQAADERQRGGLRRVVVDGDGGLRRTGAQAIAARTLPRRARSIAAASSRRWTSNAGSPAIEAAIAFDTALASWSTSPIGIRLGLSWPLPKIAPKNAAMTIGAAIDMTSARRFEK